MNLKELINSSKGRLFTVTFIKKDNTVRQLTGRLGVKKHLKGGEKRNHTPTHLIVFDMIKKAYRTVNLETVQHLKVDGKQYKVDGNKIYLEVGDAV